MSLVLDLRRERLLQVRDRIDASGGGSLLVFGSEQPTVGEAVADAPLLIIALDPVSFTLHATEASMSLAVEGNAAVSGVPLWARFVDGAGGAVMDLAAGLPGSGKPVIVSDGEPVPGNHMYVGGVVTVTCSIAEAA